MDSKKHDELVLQYLDTIDTYQSQKKQFSSELSAGYLALAQANFHSAGVRYGKDFYDERMTAIKRIQLDPRSENTVFSLKPRETADDVVEKPIDTQSSTIRRRKGAGPETEEKVEEEEAKVDEKEVEKKPQIDIQDPIRWFGILVPQSLRTSQNHFSSSKLIHQLHHQAISNNYPTINRCGLPTSTHYNHSQARQPFYPDFLSEEHSLSLQNPNISTHNSTSCVASAIHIRYTEWLYTSLLRFSG